MQPPDDRGVDWTGVRPDDFPIAPLDGRTFVERLQRLDKRTLAPRPDGALGEPENDAGCEAEAPDRSHVA